jgi:hypothetical protein
VTIWQEQPLFENHKWVLRVICDSHLYFYLDGTFVESKALMDSEMAELFLYFLEKMLVAVIFGVGFF